MKLFKKTLPAQDGHAHVAYLDDADGIALLGVSEGHTHRAMWQPEVPEQPEQPEQVDPNTGQLLSPAIPGQPEQPGRWVIEPGADGHEHVGFQDIILKETEQVEEPENEVVQEVQHDYATTTEIEADSRRDAEEADRFYCGDHWDQQDKQTLDGLDRAHLTINKVERNIDQLSGYQREQRTDLKFTPQEDGDQKGSDILNIIWKIDAARCFFAREESKVFEDASITGRANFNFLVDFSKDLRGVVVVEKFPWNDVSYGEHEKEDLSDLEVAFKHKMYSRSKVKQLWPKKADKIDGIFEKLNPASGIHTQYASGQYEKSTNSVNLSLVPTTINGTPYIDTVRKEVRVLERWKRIYKPVTILAIPQYDFFFPAWNWNDEDIEQAKTIQTPEGYILRTLEKNIQKMRITKICGDVVLSDENPASVPGDDFHLVPVYGKKRGNRWWGKVKPMIDPQREINKRHSQAIDIGNKMSVYGYFYDDSTFSDEKDKRDFVENSTSPGWVIKVASIDRRPVKEEGTKFPAELVQLLQLEDQQLESIANIVATPGGANESGFAFLQKMKQRLTGNQYLFDNLMFAKQKIGRLYIKAVQEYYPPTRILRMIRSKKAGDDAAIGGIPVEDWDDDDILKILEDTDFSLYDVEVTESPYSATARTATFILMTELTKAGAQVPPEVLIEGAEVPDAMKKKIQDAYAQQAAASKEAQDSTARMEINKTLAARGIFTPEVKAMIGEPTAQPQQAEAPLPDIQGDGGITAG